MDGQLQAFDRIADLMDSRGMETNQATLVAALMRKPQRATALEQWIDSHPEATDRQVWDQAVKIARMVEPTRHGMPPK